MALGVSFDIEEMVQFQKVLGRVEKVPQKVINRAVTAGGKIARAAVEAAAPVGKTGKLHKGFKRYPEKSRKKGKGVYRFAMSDSESKNKIFQKKIPAPGTEHPGKRRTSWDHAYYPNSVEYGFLTRKAGGGLGYVQGKGKDKVKGQHFARDAAEKSRPQVESTIIKTAISELEKEWQKK